MTAREEGFLLLTSHLGDPERKPLTVSQFRTLAERMRGMEKPSEERDLSIEDLLQLGYGREMAEQILVLLSQERLLKHYLKRGQNAGCRPVTRVSEGYPLLLRQRLGLESPGCLWIRGDDSLLSTPAIALVGSRDLRESNRKFAQTVGTYVAEHGLTLVSGNARGADKTAQEACLAAGGKVISIVADELDKHPLRKKLLYVSEDGFQEGFSAQRAISRNRCIHALGQMVFVAQSALGKGGTWDGTVKNLRKGISPVVCFRDGSEASMALEQMGAYLIDTAEVGEFQLLSEEPNLFNR